MDEKYEPMLLAVFSMISQDSQRMVPTKFNPIHRSLEEKARRFRRDAIYYDYGEPIEFNRIYEAVTKDVCNVKRLKDFQKVLIQLMAEKYHVNSYVQESLVDMYRSVDIFINRLRQPFAVSTKAENLFYRLLSFGERLEKSMQRGPVRWGFIKVRSFWHWDIVVVFRYFYDMMWRLLWYFGSKSSTCTCGFSPIEIETAWLVHHMKDVNSTATKAIQQRKEQFLSREIRDVETLYWATRESDVASMIFVSACLTFLSSLVFTVARIFSVGVLTKLVFLSAAVSSLGALLAIFHLLRKSFILVRLWLILYEKENNVKQIAGSATDKAEMKYAMIRRNMYQKDLRLLRSVTLTQLLLTLARFVTASSASVAFCLALANSIVKDQTWFPSNLPFWIAAGAFCTAVGSVIFFFIVEYVVRDKLSTELGPFVCTLFQTEINESLQAMQSIANTNRVDAPIKHDIITWEYTAREFLHQYRFDTVFAADRFGQILQCLQSNGYRVAMPTSEPAEINENRRTSARRREKQYYKYSV
jgi:hypothetical protein